MFSLPSPFVVVSVVSQTVEWVARERGPHYDCMFDERLNFASFPTHTPLLNKEEDIKLKSKARSTGRSERVGGVRGDAAYIFVLYYFRRNPRGVPSSSLASSSAIQDYFISADSALTDNNNTKEEEEDEEATQAAEA